MTTTAISLDQYASRDEATYARKLVDVILARGYTISVNDGEEWTVKRSTDKYAILAAMATAGEDSLAVRTMDGEKVGTFFLVYQDGAGDEVISDCSDNPETDSIYREVVPA